MGERLVTMVTSSARAFLDEISNVRIEKPFAPQALRTLVNERVR